MPAPTPDADLGEILAFTRVVQTGSFTAAATSLGMPKSTVSRKISELEARVGARLLQRTTRTLSLTEVGRIYHAHALRIVQELEEAQRAVSQRQATPRGTLRVTTPVSFSPLGPILVELLRDLGCEVDGPVVVPDGIPTSLGSGIFAMLAAGIFKTVEEAQDTLCLKYRTYNPEPAAVAVYDKLYRHYRAHYFNFGEGAPASVTMLETFRQLREISHQSHATPQEALLKA